MLVKIFLGILAGIFLIAVLFVLINIFLPPPPPPGTVTRTRPIEELIPCDTEWNSNNIREVIRRYIIEDRPDIELRDILVLYRRNMQFVDASYTYIQDNQSKLDNTRFNFQKQEDPCGYYVVSDNGPGSGIEVVGLIEDQIDLPTILPIPV